MTEPLVRAALPDRPAVTALQLLQQLLIMSASVSESAAEAGSPGYCTVLSVLSQLTHVACIGAAAVKAKSAAGQANPTLRAPATRPGPEPRASQLNLLAEVAGRDLQRAEQHAEVPGTGRVQQAQRHQLVEPAAEAGCAETRGGNSKQVGASGEGRSSKRNSEAMGAGPSGAAHDSPAAEPKRVRRSPAERHDAAGEAASLLS